MSSSKESLDEFGINSDGSQILKPPKFSLLLRREIRNFPKRALTSWGIIAAGIALGFTTDMILERVMGIDQGTSIVSSAAVMAVTYAVLLWRFRRQVY